MAETESKGVTVQVFVEYAVQEDGTLVVTLCPADADLDFVVGLDWATEEEAEVLMEGYRAVEAALRPLESTVLRLEAKPGETQLTVVS